jgi:hypothetical protein
MTLDLDKFDKLVEFVGRQDNSMKFGLFYALNQRNIV